MPRRSALALVLFFFTFSFSLPFHYTNCFFVQQFEKGGNIYNKSASKDVDGKRNGHKYKDTDEIIRIEDAVPPLIDKGDFEIVRKKMANRKQTQKHSRAKETYLLKTKMFCGICGGAYVGTSRVRGSKGQYWGAFGCNIHHRHKDACSNGEAQNRRSSQY